MCLVIKIIFYLNLIALKEKLPGPGQHSPKTNFLEHQTNSKHRHLGQTVFGKNERKALEKEFHVRPDITGPGKYSSVSEFGRYSIPTVAATVVPNK